VVRGDRSHLQHAEAGSPLSGGGRTGADLRARAAHSRARQEAAEQTPRRDVGDGVRQAGISAGSDDELPRAARLVARDQPGGVLSDELVAAFSLEGISGGNAVFNPEKLDWFNQQYIVRLSADELTRRLKPLLESAASGNEEYAAGRREWFAAVLDLFRPRAKRLDDFRHAEAGCF